VPPVELAVLVEFGPPRRDVASPEGGEQGLEGVQVVLADQGGVGQEADEEVDGD